MNRHSASPLLALASLTLLATGCSDGSAGPSAPVIDPQLVEDVRTLLAAENVGAVTGPSFRAELVDLGEALFFDKIISGNEDVACATCHFPDLGSADERCLPSGVGGTELGFDRAGGAVVPRNSPMVLNAHLSADLFWDGRVDRQGDGSVETPAGAAFTSAITDVFEPGLESLAAQAMLPPTSRAEMRGELGDNEIGDVADGDVTGIWNAIVNRVTALPPYREMLAAAYAGTTVLDWNMGHLGNAIAAWEATAFARFDSPFQRFVEGDDAALSNEQLEGAKLFYSEAGCQRCHSGSSFSDGSYHNIGLAQWGPGKGDGPGGADDFGRERVTGSAADRYRFRTPSLLNVELTAPYGRLGQFSTLESIVGHYRNPENSLRNFDPTVHADDPSLVTSVLDNVNAVLDRLAPELATPRAFDSGAVTEFLRALTADSARDMSDLTPASVPSGLPVDAI